MSAISSRTVITGSTSSRKLSACEMKSTDDESCASTRAPKQFLTAEKVTDEAMLSLDNAELKIVWRNVVVYILLHVAASYGLYLLVAQALWPTVFWSIILHMISGIGITGGAHRLWSHRSFKATKPMRYLLVIMNTMAFQNDVIEWARDHRVHHKWSETNADPHNARRGLFFSHIGWLLVRKHPLVKEKGRTIDLGDLYRDEVLVWQRKNFYSLSFLFVVFFPTVIPNVCWGETLWTAYFSACICRYVLMLHSTWTINSIAHLWGERPYDADISPVQNVPSAIVAYGEGWHNYHHTFPQDYRASENPYLFNLTTLFLDGFAQIGWVYDRRTTPQPSVDRRKEIALEKNLRKKQHVRQRSVG